MLPGPIKIKKCSNCYGLIREFTLMSGNTFGATFWTDGYRDAPMLPEQLWLIKCPHCKMLLWIDEQENLGKTDPDDSDEKFLESISYSIPDIDDYLSIFKI
jgi:hypothetical protein